MKIIGVGSLMFLIAASLLSERLQVFFSAQRYTSISTSLLYGCFESEKNAPKHPLVNALVERNLECVSSSNFG